MSDLDTAQGQMQAAISASTVGDCWSALRGAVSSLGRVVEAYATAGDLVAEGAALNVQASIQNIVNQSPNPCGTLANLQQGTLTSIAGQLTALPPEPAGSESEGGRLIVIGLVTVGLMAVGWLWKKG